MGGAVVVGRVGAVLAIVIGTLIAGVGETGVRAQSGPQLHYSAIYFPWVAHGDDIDGVGPWYGSITVQNVATAEHPERNVMLFALDERWIWSIANDVTLTLEDALEGLTEGSILFSRGQAAPRFHLAPNASQTLTPDLLGIAEPGSGLIVLAVYRDNWEFLQQWGEAMDERAPVIAGITRQSTPLPMTGGTRTGQQHQVVDGYSAIPLADVPWGAQSDFCHELRGHSNACDSSGLYRLPDSGFDGHAYLPIVQTNSGWNTQLYLTNVDFTQTTAASVDLTFIRSDQLGSASSGEHKWSETIAIAPGSTARLDLRSLVGPDWVGSVHITSEVGIVSAAYRQQAAEQMLMINTAAPSLQATTAEDGFAFQSMHEPGYRQYAPLIFQDYEGWNTGLSLANIAEHTSTIFVTFINPSGNRVGFDQRTISAQGQEYIYIPASGDVEVESGFVGAAIFESARPFHVTVDQVKYATGDAMSYLATAAGASLVDDVWPAPGPESSLLLPLVQKGQQDGSGDFTGIQLLNTEHGAGVTVEIQFFDGSGAAVAPTRAQPLRATLGPTEGATIYTMNLIEMSGGQRASAVVRPVQGEGAIVGVANSVNYEVDGDGSTALNLVNTTGQHRQPEP
jgi:hypothetical protein